MADETEKIEEAAADAADKAEEAAGQAKRSLREIAEAVEAEAAERKAAAEAEAAAASEAVADKAADVVETVEKAADDAKADDAKTEATEAAEAKADEKKTTRRTTRSTTKASGEKKTTTRRRTTKKDDDDKAADSEDEPKTKRSPRKKPAKKSVGAKADTATRGKASDVVKEDVAEVEAAVEEAADKGKPKSKSVKAREAKAEAKAAKDAAIAENKGESYVAEAPRKGTSWLVALGLALLGCALGLLLGRFVLPGNFTPGISADNSTLSAEGLDSNVGMLSYKGESIAITAREVLESTVGVDAALNDDGSYDMPAADDVLSFARNSILNKEVEAAGIEVTDEDITAYMTEVMGTDDIAAMATQYGLDEESAKKIIQESAGVRKLYDQVTAEAGTASAMPEAPTAPAEDADASAATPEYASYIIGLLGDEWDSENNTWAREDGPYYAQMSSMDFSADGATYDQAQTAYYVAYTNYATQATTAQQLWTDYVNGLLSGASISIASLAS